MQGNSYSFVRLFTHRSLSDHIADQSNSIVVVKVPLQIASSIWFLNSILGWSAFVGLLVMVLLFPVPIWLGSVIQRVQIGRMGKVR